MNARILVTAAGLAGWAVVVATFKGPGVYTPLAIYAGLFAALLVALDRERLATFRPDARAVAIGIAGALVMIAGSYGSFALASSLFPAVHADVAVDYATTNIGGNWAVVPLLVVVIVAEEVIWREALFDPAHPIRSGAISVALYVAVQIGFGSWVVFALAAVCGVLWTIERAYTKSLVAPILTHGIWNLTVLVAFPLI